MALLDFVWVKIRQIIAQYRLRVDRMRVFYDVNDKKSRVKVLGFAIKPEAAKWLNKHGVQE